MVMINEAIFLVHVNSTRRIVRADLKEDTIWYKFQQHLHALNFKVPRVVIASP